MFDPQTASTITAAPRLSRVDSERLPSRITDAYVRVAVTSSLLGANEDENDDLFEDLRSIAAAQEAMALSLEPGDERSAAAFVAASAYRVITEHDSGGSKSKVDRLTPNGVSTRLASMLLFLAADASADANEVANDLEIDPSDDYAGLLTTLRDLGAGSLRGRREPTVRWPDQIDAHPSDIASNIGYRRCEVVLIDLLSHLSSRNSQAWEANKFEEIASTMNYEIDIETPEGRLLTDNIVLGPWHLARLLHLAEPTLLAAATVDISTPSGVEPESWTVVVERIARSRPLLWRNHRVAIDRGLLTPGVSAVLAFPTGAGKSTVSELKVAATVLVGKNVVCLVPTLSLIDQLARSLQSTIPWARVTAQRDLEDFADREPGDGPEIFVMTPESCLAALGVAFERFGDVGLVMFDEAHLMHLGGEVPTRRAVDASLCFLTLSARFPDADLLLVSAMLQNAEELAAWLAATTNRTAIALDSSWKPTRQARGALVYLRKETTKLRRLIDEEFDVGETIGAPVALKRQMLARPYGLFSLGSTWESKSARDYRLMRLLDEPVQLEVRGNRRSDHQWWLSPNSNSVAAKLAAAAASSGLKTLVFAQQVSWVGKIASDVTGELPHTTALIRTERMLLERTVELLGDKSALYLDVADGIVTASAIPHHGLLLPEERRLHESLYRRPDGVSVLAATSTVAQGMNFPSELVIIASDWRFDADANARTRLEAHELLNAAGRAGRAGSHSNALVLVIPGNIVTFDGKSQIDDGWFQLRETFSQSDQCLVLQDPLAAVLESLDAPEESSLLEYVTRRIENVADSVIGPSILRKSLAAFAAGRDGNGSWIEQRIELLQKAIEREAAEPWLRQCALVSGLPISTVAYISDRLRVVEGEDWSLTDWREWFLGVLLEQPEILEQVLRSGSRAALRGTVEELGEWDSEGQRLVARVRHFLQLWMEGASLREIQHDGVANELARRSDRHFEFARKFVLRVIPDLAYLFGLPALIQHQRATAGLDDELSDQHPLTLLARCVEAGVDSVAKLLLLETSAAITRYQVHQLGTDFVD